MKVSEFLFKIKNILEGNLDLRDVWVEGELSQPKFYGTSIYFNLKEESENGVLGCYVSKDYYHKLLNKTEWKDGVKLKILGYISVWNKQGTFKFIVQDLEKDDGLGQKFLQLEKLKKKLESEGLFDGKHKKKIPKYPQKIGVITSLQGAAIHDIFRTMKKNSVYVDMIIFPSLVQGDAAPESLINALLEADQMGLDLLIITRGGGSFEDLFCFNDEQLARTIFRLKTPIISAVGHETDFTICDLVADLRVSTPTQSINELPNFNQESDILFNIQNELTRDILDKLKKSQSDLTLYEDAFKSKIDNLLSSNQNTLQSYSHQLELLFLNVLEQNYKLTTTLLYDIKNQLNNSVFFCRNNLNLCFHELNNNFKNTLSDENYFIKNQYDNIIFSMQNIIAKHRENIQTEKQNFSHQIAYLIQNEKNQLKNLELELENNNHAKILEKGYSITLKNGKIIKSRKDLQIGDTIETVIHEGSFESLINKL